MLPGVHTMRARLARFTNDIVSLSVLMLMSIALIAGQAGAAQQAAAAPGPEIQEHVLGIDLDLSCRQQGD